MDGWLFWLDMEIFNLRTKLRTKIHKTGQKWWRNWLPECSSPLPSNLFHRTKKKIVEDKLLHRNCSHGKVVMQRHFTKLYGTKWKQTIGNLPDTFHNPTKCIMHYYLSTLSNMGTIYLFYLYTKLKLLKLFCKILCNVTYKRSF